MSAASAPSFRATRPLPELPGNAAGIRIRAEVYERTGGAGSIRVIGAFRIRADAAVRPSILHALTLVVARAPELAPVCFSAAGQALVFDDDIVREGDFQSAAFDLDVFACAGLEPAPATYFLSACLHDLLSNVERAELST